jgi:replication initiation protein RepC
MQHISTTPFGRRAVSHGLLASQAMAAAPAAVASADKWQLFNDLRTARHHFRVTDRDLSVLNALLTFLPDRELVDGADLIVFPSNATLSDRAHGMAESTLRRHLAALVQAGLIARHDSPNGKRYATRDRGGEVLRAFGFSLRPLLVRAPAIQSAAEDARTAALHLKLTREAVVLRLRDAVKLFLYAVETGQATADHPLHRALCAAQGQLRRKLDADALTSLQEMVDQLRAAVDNLLDPVVVSEEMSGNDVHFGRHYQYSKPDLQESEPCLETGKGADVAPPALPLGLVVKACPDILPYAQGHIRSWHELIAAASQVRPMMGVSPDAWAEAQRIMGAEVAAITLAAVLQRVGAIQKPGAYLRNLTERAANGQFSPGPMIMALLSPANARAV